MLKVFSIKDIKADCFGAPFLSPAFGTAERDFVSAMRDSNSVFGKFPEDYELWFIGEWEPNTARFSGLDQPEFVCVGADLLKVRGGE